LVQKEQVQARAGISAGSGTQFSLNEMFPQWQLPEMSTERSWVLRDAQRRNKRRQCAFISFQSE
jgi:hypothetical protein